MERVDGVSAERLASNGLSPISLVDAACHVIMDSDCGDCPANMRRFSGLKIVMKTNT